MARRRGQAALEFLSTYGFAFLLILVMIAALSYFGILNPQRFVPTRCLVSTEFTCRDSQLASGTTALNIQLINNNPNQISITAVGANAPTISGTATACTVNGGGVPQNVGSGAIFTVSCTGITGTWPPVGDKLKANFSFTYTQTGLPYPKSAAGEVLQTVS